MRLFLLFTLLFLLVPSIHGKCHWPKCEIGSVLENNATLTSNGDLREAEDGCVLSIDPNCNFRSDLRASKYSVAFGKCRSGENNVTICAQLSEDVNFVNPHLTVEVFDRLIQESGFKHCARHRTKFAELEKERESCITRGELIAIILGSIGGVILLILLGVGITYLGVFVWILIFLRNCKRTERELEEAHMRRIERERK